MTTFFGYAGTHSCLIGDNWNVLRFDQKSKSVIIFKILALYAGIHFQCHLKISHCHAH